MLCNVLKRKCRMSSSSNNNSAFFFIIFEISRIIRQFTWVTEFRENCYLTWSGVQLFFSWVGESKSLAGENCFNMIYVRGKYYSWKNLFTKYYELIPSNNVVLYLAWSMKITLPFQSPTSYLIYYLIFSKQSALWLYKNIIRNTNKSSLGTSVFFKIPLVE